MFSIFVQWNESSLKFKTWNNKLVMKYCLSAYLHKSKVHFNGQVFFFTFEFELNLNLSPCTVNIHKISLMSNFWASTQGSVSNIWMTIIYIFSVQKKVRQSFFIFCGNKHHKQTMHNFSYLAQNLMHARFIPLGTEHWLANQI